MGKSDNITALKTGGIADIHGWIDEQRVKNGVNGVVALTFCDGKMDGIRFVGPLDYPGVVAGLDFAKFGILKDWYEDVAGG